MPWDDTKALEAMQEFHTVLKQLETDYSHPMTMLREAWKKAYLTCGHKRLGRIVLGQTPEEANR